MIKMEGPDLNLKESLQSILNIELFRRVKTYSIASDKSAITMKLRGNDIRE